MRGRGPRYGLQESAKSNSFARHTVLQGGSSRLASCPAPEDRVGQEFGTELVADPIVTFKDDSAVYDKEITAAIMQVDKDRGLNIQPAVFENFGSDASAITCRGLTGRSALLCIPTLNTHGFELIHRNGVGALAKL